MDSSWDFEALSRSFSARQSRLAVIRAAVQDILAAATEAPSDAYDLDKLVCRDIEHVTSDKAGEYYRAIITGADPAADKLQLWLLTQLNQRGFPDVLVSTEW